jgi:opacity protein-like surface antigen
MRRMTAIVIGIWLVLTVAAAAQTSTGRHRAESEEEATEQEVASPSSSRFWIGAGAGLATSGNLLRIRTAGESGIPWNPAGGASFVSENVLLTMDESVALAASFGGRLSDPLWYRLDGSLSTIDLAAEARVGEVAESFLWDRLGFVIVTAALEYRLTSADSFPYLFGGAGLMMVSGDEDDQFDQTRPTWRLGAGYQQRLTPDWSLRAEVRDAVASLDVDDYVPPVVGNQLPDYRIEEKGPQHVFELLLTLNGSF